MAGLAAIGLSPAGLLDTASKLKGTDKARLAARGQPFGPNPRQRLDVWAPPGDPPAEGWPVLLFFYGGGWVSGARGDYGFVGRAFAARGYLTLIPDYRLTPPDRFPAFVEDAALAIAWAGQHALSHGGDPSRIGVSGHSAGAYNAALAVLDQRFLKAGGGDPAMVRAAAFLSGPFDFPDLVARGAMMPFRGAPVADSQPVTFARADAPPMLLVTGTADVTVRARNSQSLARALKAAGATVELRLYPGAAHTDTLRSLSPLFRDATPAFSDCLAFLDRHLKTKGDGP